MEQWLQELCSNIDRALRLEGIAGTAVSGYKGTGRTYINVVVEDEPLIMEGWNYEVVNPVTKTPIRTVDVMDLIGDHERGAQE